jgi:hypothetical protein
MIIFSNTEQLKPAVRASTDWNNDTTSTPTLHTEQRLVYAQEGVGGVKEGSLATDVRARAFPRCF